MAEYISKSALVAEINDWRDKIKKGVFGIPLEGRQRADAAFEYEILGRVIDFLYTLEVKEVDLEKEIKKYIKDNICGYCVPGVEETAKHFFELGLKAQKGE